MRQQGGSWISFITALVLLSTIGRWFMVSWTNILLTHRCVFFQYRVWFWPISRHNFWPHIWFQPNVLIPHFLRNLTYCIQNGSHRRRKALLAQPVKIQSLRSPTTNTTLQYVETGHDTRPVWRKCLKPDSLAIVKQHVWVTDKPLLLSECTNCTCTIQCLAEERIDRRLSYRVYTLNLTGTCHIDSL